MHTVSLPFQYLIQGFQLIARSVNVNVVAQVKYRINLNGCSCDFCFCEHPVPSPYTFFNFFKWMVTGSGIWHRIWIIRSNCNFSRRKRFLSWLQPVRLHSPKQWIFESKTARSTPITEILNIVLSTKEDIHEYYELKHLARKSSNTFR